MEGDKKRGRGGNDGCATGERGGDGSEGIARPPPPPPPPPPLSGFVFGIIARALSLSRLSSSEGSPFPSFRRSFSLFLLLRR